MRRRRVVYEFWRAGVSYELCRGGAVRIGRGTQRGRRVAESRGSGNRDGDGIVVEDVLQGHGDAKEKIID